MPPLSLVKASNDAWCPLYAPVIVVFGGTSGIGKAMTRRLAEQLQGRIHVIVVGRNKAAADALFASLPRPSASDAQDCTYKFVSCDISLMGNVHRATEEISKRFSKINYLILASGKAFVGRRHETEEGIDTQLVLRFYWKFAVINDLLPNLRAAREMNEAAGVFAILGKGNGPKIDFTDLGAKRNHYLGIGPLFQGLSYTDLMLSMYAEREPDVAFTHMFPGMVSTEANSPAATSNYLIKLLIILLYPLTKMFFITVSVSAEHMVYGLLSGEKGFYQRTTKADNVGPRNVTYVDADKQAFWEHCLSTTRSNPR